MIWLELTVNNWDNFRVDMKYMYRKYTLGLNGKSKHWLAIEPLSIGASTGTLTNVWHINRVLINYHNKISRVTAAQKQISLTIKVYDQGFISSLHLVNVTCSYKMYRQAD